MCNFSIDTVKSMVLEQTMSLESKSDLEKSIYPKKDQSDLKPLDLNESQAGTIEDFIALVSFCWIQIFLTNNWWFVFLLAQKRINKVWVWEFRYDFNRMAERSAVREVLHESFINLGKESHPFDNRYVVKLCDLCTSPFLNKVWPYLSSHEALRDKRKLRMVQEIRKN